MIVWSRFTILRIVKEFGWEFNRKEENELGKVLLECLRLRIILLGGVIGLALIILGKYFLESSLAGAICGWVGVFLLCFVALMGGILCSVGIKRLAGKVKI